MGRLALLGSAIAVLVLSGSAVAGPVGPATKLAFKTSPAGAEGGSAFTTQPVVELEDADGNKVDSASATITLAIKSGTGTSGATLSSCGPVSTSSGTATFSGCELDKAGTSYTLTASDTTGGGSPHPYTGVDSATFDVTVGDASQIEFTGEPTDITAGSHFSPDVELTIEDAGGNTVTTWNKAVGIGVKPGGGPGSLQCNDASETAAPANATPGYKVTASGGVASFPSCSISKSSSVEYSLVGATTDGTNTFVTESDKFTVTSGGAAMLTFTTNPSAAVAATTFGTQPVVEVDDSSGNVIPGATGTVRVAITPATGTAGAQLSSCPGVAVSNGIATFSGCKIDLVGTNYTLTATISDKSITGTSAPFVVSSSGAASLSFTKQPGNATGGAPLSTQPEVTLKDSGGNPVSGSVTLSLVGGPAGAHLDCDANPASAGTGVAAFAGCSVDLAGNYQLKAMAPGGMQATSDSFAVSAGTAAMLVFDTQPSGVKGGTAFTHQPVVSVEDLGGNKVANSTVDLSITKGTGASGAQLTCTGGKSILAATGTAAYSGCAIDHVGSAYTLTAKSSGLAGISSTFDVQAGEGSQLVFTAQPVGGVLSSPFGGQPQVSVADAGGNPIDAPGVSVTLSISSGSLSCLGNPVTTKADGIAVFVGCKGDSTGSLTLHATGDGLTPANSASFNVVAGSLLGVSPLGVPLAQTFGGAVLGRNPAATVDDVTAGTGNLELALSDLTVAAAGEPFVLNRAYNSLDTTGGVFGPGWTSILDAGVTIAPNGQTAMVRSADGQQLVFTSNGSGGWNPPPGARASLSCTGALCTVTRFDGVTFRSIGGRIQDYLNPDGYGLHFGYLGNRLTEVTGSAQALATGIRDSLGERIGTLGWSSQSSGVGANLNAVDAENANHVWAVGNNCTIVFTTKAGSTWTKDTNVTGCSGANLTGVAVGGGAGSGWAVGQNGTLLVCSAGCDSASATWKALGGSGLPSSLLQFTGVWSPDSNHVYAVGTTAGGAGQIWSCSNNCKAGTNGGTGAKWTEVTPGGLGSTPLNAVEGSGGGLIFAAGAKGTILVCSVGACSTSSSGWSKLTAGSGGSVPDPGVTFTSIWAGDGSHVFAAGSSSGGGVVWACSAKCDKSVTGPDPIPSPPGGPASGTNAAWGDDTPAGIGPLVSVTGHGADNAWAIQPDGTIWYCSDNCTTEPTAWVSLLKPGGPGALAAIGSSDDKHAWAVGTGGKVVATLDPGATIDKLANAIGELGIALNPTAWADGNHLVPALGDQAMGHLANAIHQLSDYPAPKPPGPTTWPGWVAGGLLDLTQAMRIVDANLISENFQQPVVALSLANARSGFANGDALLAASDYQHAADSYEPVWKQALTAHGGGQGSHSPLLLHVTQADSGLVTNVTTPTRSVSYDYTGGALTTFTDANGNPWTYDYSSGRLTAMTDPDGNVRLVVGYSGGRVSSAVGKGSQNHFNDTYDWAEGSGITTRKALVRLAPGAPTKRAESFDVYSGNVLLEQQLPNGATISYSYDSQLDMTGLQDPAGVQRMTYNSAGDLLTQTSPTQGTGTATVGFTYDGAHHPTSSTDANGNTTSNTYSGNDLVKVTPPGPAAGATSYVYNLLGEQLETDGPTSTELDTLDGAGNRLSFRLLDTAHHPLNGLGPAFTYNEIGQKLILTDPRGHLPGGIDATYTQTNTYDGVGNLLTTTSPGPQLTTTEYDKAGDVTSTKNPAGKTTAFVWDEPALTRTSTGPGGATTTDLYDASGNLLQTTDPGGRTTRYTYDATGDQTSVTRPSAITTYYTFDLTGNVLTAVDDAGNSSTFTYDKRHRLLTQDEHGITGATGYDAAGKVVSKTDGDGNVTTWDYTSHELPNHVTTAAGTTTFGYDLGDNLISVTDGKGHVTSYRVDGAGRRTQMTVNGHSWTYSYDVAGNLVQTTDPDGRTASYTVNPLNLRTQIEFSQPGHPTITVTQTFDPLGHRIGMTDSTGTHSYAYDDGGNLTSAINPSGNFTYDYSHPGKMIETYPDGTKETYAFDDAHDVMSVDSSTGVQVSYIRNAARRITGLAYGNGIFQTQSLSKAGLINGIALLCGQTLELTSATSYSAGGAPRSQALTAGDKTTTTSFGYDGSARVSAQASSMDFAGLAATTPTPGCTSGSPASPGSPDGNDGSGTTTMPAAPLSANQPVGPTLPDPAMLPNLSPIGYDAVGNQISIGGTSISYNAADEVSSQTGTTPASYAYDSAGNITDATVGAVHTSYSYDAAGRLVKVVRGSTTVDYSYDGDGNRVGRTVTVSGTTTSDDTLSWDPSGQVPLLTLERDSSSHTLVARFTYGVGPVAMETPGGTYYLHTDGRGDVIALSGASGAVLASYLYDAFGNVTATATGATPVPAEPLLFQGQLLDSATGLYDMRARNYDPTTGRFTQRDSVGPALGEPVFSPYVFAHDMPTTKADPTGLVTEGQVSDLGNQAFNGHSTENGNYAADARYGAIGAKVSIKAGPKIVAFFSETAAAAAPGIEEGAAAAARGLAEASEGAAGAEASAGERLGSASGKLLGAAGVALAVYFTVEDCEHGTVYQCVGDSVGLAIGAACLVATEGIGSVACALAAAGIGIVIAEYGPEMVAGLVDLGQYAAEGATVAIAAISKGFDAAGESLTSAYAEAASQVSAGFALVGTAIVSGFDTAIGAISTGFDQLGSYLSSGFADALSTLEQAGLDAAEFAGLLKDAFGEGFNNAVDALITFGYDVDGVAKSLENVFSTGAAAAATFLKDNWNYTYDQIASGLETAYDQLAEGAASILKNIGAGVDDIAGALKNVYDEFGAGTAQILQGLNYTIDQISTELKDIYNLADQATAQILKGLDYTVNEIAGTLQSVFNDAYQGAAQVLNDIGYQVTEIASAIRDAFSSVSDVDMAALLQNTLGFTPQDVANALQTAYGETADAVASVLHDIGDTAEQIKNVLQDFFGETIGEIGSTLQNWFDDSIIGDLGGAFTSFGDTLSDIGNEIVSWFEP